MAMMTHHKWSKVRNRIIEILKDDGNMYQQLKRGRNLNRIIDTILEDPTIQKWIKPFLDVRSSEDVYNDLGNYLKNLINVLDETGILIDADFEEDELTAPNSGFAG